MSAPSEERHRLKRAPVFKPHLADHTGVDGKLRPGKLAAQESAFLRRTGGVDVPRAPVMRGAKRIIAQTVPLIWAENRRFARRLQVDSPDVSLCSSLTVPPATRKARSRQPDRGPCSSLEHL